MNYEMISIATMMVIFVIGGLNLKRAKKKLNDNQREIASQVISESKKGITQISFVLIILFMVWLFVVSELNYIVVSLFFLISLVLHVVYLLRLKRSLSLRDLPPEYASLTLKGNVLFIVGLFIVLLAFVVNVF